MKKAFVKIGFMLILMVVSTAVLEAQTVIDLKVESCDLPATVKAGSNVELKTTFKNVGGEVVNTFTYTWIINNTGVKKSAVISDVNIEIGATKAIAHKFFVEFPLVTCDLDIQVYVTNVNGGNDKNTANDTILMNVKVEDGYKQRIAVIDHFTSINCMPCAVTGPALEKLLHENGNMDKVAYLNIHTGLFIGIETLHNSAAKNRDDLYAPTTFPQVYVGGEFRGMPDKITQGDISREYYEPSYLKSNCAYKINGGVIEVGGTVENLMDFTSDVRLFFAVVENIEFNKAPGSNGEKHFTNVLRKFISEDSGLALSTIENGGVSSFREQWHMFEDMDIAKITVYMFLQDMVTKKYFAAERLKIGEIITGNECLRDIDDQVKVIAYGREVKVSSLTGEEFEVEVLNMNGQLINKMRGSDCRLTIKKAGVYVVRVIGDKVNHSRKIIIN